MFSNRNLQSGEYTNSKQACWCHLFEYTLHIYPICVSGARCMQPGSRGIPAPDPDPRTHNDCFDLSMFKSTYHYDQYATGVCWQYRGKLITLNPWRDTNRQAPIFESLELFNWVGIYSYWLCRLGTSDSATNGEAKGMRIEPHNIAEYSVNEAKTPKL